MLFICAQAGKMCLWSLNQFTLSIHKNHNCLADIISILLYKIFLLKTTLSHINNVIANKCKNQNMHIEKDFGKLAAMNIPK